MSNRGFKVGDLVVCVNRGWAWFTPGQPYKVAAAEDAHGYIRVGPDNEGDTFWWDTRHFELTARSETAAARRALRFNAGKPELHYADCMPAALAGISLSFTYGCKRAENAYPPYNWCLPASYVELYDAARRHMCKALNGEDFDPDAVSQGFMLHHLDSALGNLARLRQQIADGTIVDDRAPEALRKSQEAAAARKDKA